MKHSRFAGIVLALVMLFLYLPIVVLVANSFNLSRYGGEWAGFTLDWYAKLFTQNRPIWEAFERSLLIAATATVASCVLGTTAALALHRWKDRLQTVHYGLIYTPLVMPEILMGISLLMICISKTMKTSYRKTDFKVLDVLLHFTFGVAFKTEICFPQSKLLYINLF